MNSEDYDAWIEQQTREINNLLNMRKAERQRAEKIIWNIQKQTVRNSASYKICNKILKEITETK